MKKITLGIACSVIFLAGCTTSPNGNIRSVGCGSGTNYGGAALGAVGGAVVGSFIGGGTGNTLATLGGAAVGGYAGSKTNVGCN